MATATNNNKSSNYIDHSKDEVDYIVVAANINNNNNYDSNKVHENNVPKATTTNTTTTVTKINPPNNSRTPNNKDSTKETLKSSKKKVIENTEKEPKKISTKERLSLFSFSKKLSQKSNNSSSTTTTTTATSKESHEQAAAEKPTSTLPCHPPFVPIGTPPRQHKFVKSSSISRLLGNTYNAKKYEKSEQKRLTASKFNTFSGRRRAAVPHTERFKQCSKEDGDIASNGGITLTTDSRDLFGGSRSELVCLEHMPEGGRNEDLGAKAMRTLTRGLGKLWWKRSQSAEISTPDPEFKVSYLGNVLTGWAKGEGCVEKQLNTLWRNYTQNNKPDVIMRIKVCASGLKATTRQHGLTEYWANRITHCCAPKNYPRVFCWIYRHEGRKLKHELRCHAVLCSKEKIVQDICNTLKENLERALREFKREKILKQNARLSLANAAYDNPSLPRRKILLSVGGNNYRPPLERSKSAPKLMAIEEAIGEEDGEDIEETNEPEMKSCCQKDSLYPAMTLGRRRCRRGHSIRRTGKARPNFSSEAFEPDQLHAHGCCSASAVTKEVECNAVATDKVESEEQRNSYGSDDSDDFEKLLKYNNYDTNASLANELLPYFDMQLHKNTSISLGSLSELKDNANDEGEPLSLLPTINSDPSADPDADYSPNGETLIADNPVVVGLRRDGICSDGEEDDYLEVDDMYFRQATLLNMLHRNSMRKMANLSLSSDESSIETNVSAPLQYRHQMQSSISSNASSTATSASAKDGGASATQRGKQVSADSDEGSISSGCETASTVTANQDDISLNYCHSKQAITHTGLEAALRLDEEPISVEEIYQGLESRLQGRHNSDATTFSSSSSITLKMGASPTASVVGGGLDGGGVAEMSNSTSRRRTRRQREQRAEQGDSDSEYSDESGYVEYQEKDKRQEDNVGGHIQTGLEKQTPLKPQPPPKPLPRRLLAAAAGTTTAV